MGVLTLASPQALMISCALLWWYSGCHLTGQFRNASAPLYYETTITYVVCCLLRHHHMKPNYTYKVCLIKVVYTMQVWTSMLCVWSVGTKGCCTAHMNC